MDKQKELDFMLHFAREAFLDEEVCADQLRSLWTAYCLHHGLDADTKAYDDDLMEVWKAVSEEEFAVMMQHAVGKVKSVHEQILKGEVEPRPYRNGQETGCDYCGYRNICGFDTRLNGYEYRKIRKMSLEEAIAAMKGVGKTWE